jgi:hypothetical protein
MTDKIGLLPSCWGSALWHSIHSIAFVYDPSMNRQKYYDFFANLGYVLPCEECRLHYNQHFNRDKLINALESNEGLFRWTYDLHNAVNKGTGVPESKWPSYETVKIRYNNYTASCSTMPGTCGANLSNKKIKVVEEFGNHSDNTIYCLKSLIVVLFILLIISICINIYQFNKK